MPPQLLSVFENPKADLRKDGEGQQAEDDRNQQAEILFAGGRRTSGEICEDDHEQTEQTE